MSAFAIFAIVVTLCYVIYYAAIITLDMNAKPKDIHDDSVIIDNDGTDTSNVSDDDNNGITSEGIVIDNDDDTTTAIEWNEENEEANNIETPSTISFAEDSMSESSDAANDIIPNNHHEDESQDFPIYINKEEGDNDNEEEVDIDATTDEDSAYSDSYESEEQQNLSEDSEVSEEPENTELENSAEDTEDESSVNEIPESEDSTERDTPEDSTNEESSDLNSHQIIDDDEDIVYEDPVKQEEGSLFADPEPEYDITDEFGDEEVEPSEKVKRASSNLEPIDAESKNGLMSREYMASLQESELVAAVMGNLDSNVDNIVVEHKFDHC